MASLTAQGFLGDPDAFSGKKRRSRLRERAIGRSRPTELGTVGFPLPFRFVVDLTDAGLEFFAVDERGGRTDRLGAVPRSEVESATVDVSEPLPMLAVKVRDRPGPLRLVLGLTAADGEVMAQEFQRELQRA